MWKQYPPADDSAEDAVWKGKPNFVTEKYGSIVIVDERMIMLERGEPASNHSILKKPVGLELTNQAFVELWKPQLPSLPSDGVTALHQTRGSPRYRYHLQLPLDYGHTGRKLKAALHGRSDDDLFPDNEHEADLYGPATRGPV